MNKISQKLKSGIISHKDYLIAIGIVFVLFNFMLAINGAWPYGNMSIVHSDTFAQIAPFFEHIFKTLKGETSLFYTSAFAGGTEILTTLIYMLICPFYLVLFLFGEHGIYSGFSLVLFLMLLFNAITFLWFSKKYFKNIGSVTRMLLTLTFVFCGYACANYGFLTWQVYPGILILLTDAFLRLVNEKKIGRFIAILVWYVVESFGTGVSSNFILLLLFFGFILFTKDKEERKGASLRLFVAYLVSVLICVAILVPAIFSMTESSRNSNLMTNLLSCSTFNELGTKLAGLFLESGIAIFAVLYLIKCNKKDKINKFYFLALAVVFVPVVFDVCQKILCGSIYMAFPFRFLFINAVLLFILASKYFDSQKATEEIQNELPQKSSFVFKFLIIFVISAFVLGLLFLDIFAGKNVSANIKNPITKSKVTLLYFLITVLFVLIVLVAFIGKWRKALSQKFFKIALTSVLALTLLFNYTNFALAGSEKLTRLNEASSFVSEQKIDGRLKFFQLDESSTQSNTYMYGKRTDNFFSSLISPATINSFKSIGYSTGETFTDTMTGFLLSDSLIGSNLYLSAYEQNRPYLKLISKSENFYLYENLLASTGAVVLPEGFEFDKNLESYENFERLAKAFEIEGELFLQASVLRDEVKYFKSVEYYTQKITFVAPEDGILYIGAKAKYIDDDPIKKSVDDDLKYHYLSSMNGDCFSDISYVKKGETVEFVISADRKNYIDDSKFMFMNYQPASELCEKLKENQAEIEFNKSGFAVKVSSPIVGRLFVASSNINGMNYVLDGKEVLSTNVIGEFACFDIESGTHSLVATYSYPHSLSWLVVAIVCIVLTVVVLLVYKFVNLEKLGKPTFVIFCIICICILVAVYVFGIIMSIIFNIFLL